MRTRLSSSVDAAAIAAARSISVGSTWASQVTSATTMADQYFAADFQPGMMGTTVTSTGGQPVVSIPTPTASVITVSVTAQVSVPLYFLRLIGQNTATIAATGQASRRVTNIILVLDRSYSMQEANACGTLVTAAKNFINFFVDGTDTVGLVTFQTTANEDFVANSTFKNAIQTKLGTMVCNGYTTTADGLNLAYSRIKAINQFSALNVIVLFTDGLPDSIDATFTKKGLVDYRYGYDTNAGNALAYTNSPPAAPYNAANSTGASGCSNATYTGIMTSTSGYPYTYGATCGVFSNTGIPINSSNTYASGLIPAVVSSSGCAFTGDPSGFTYNSLAVRANIAYMPKYDLNNGGTNPLTGYKALDPCTSSPVAN